MSSASPRRSTVTVSRGDGANTIADGIAPRVPKGSLRYPWSEQPSVATGLSGYRVRVPTEQSEEILAVLKLSAAALREADIEFALGGGLAAWARGGPPTEHDIDFMIRAADAEAALAALRKEGMRTESPPEGWLVKA